MTGPLLGTVYYAHDPATDTYWAMGLFCASPFPGDSNYSEGNFQNGARNAMFKKAGAAVPWQVQSAYCPRSAAIWQFCPPAVVMAWSISTSVPLGPTGLYDVNC